MADEGTVATDPVQSPEPEVPGDAEEPSETAKPGSEVTGTYHSTNEGDDGEQDDEEEELPFPGFVPVVFRCLDQRNSVRFWCLRIITWPYPLKKIFEDRANVY